MRLYAIFTPHKNFSEFGKIFPLFFALLLFSLFIPTVNAQDTTVVQAGAGTLDHDLVDGQRWRRLNIDPLISGTHTIRVTWDSNADIRFSVFQIPDPTQPNDRLLIATTNTTSPAEWTGTLNLSEEYYLGIWSASGSANYTVTVEAANTTSSTLEISSHPADLSVTDGNDAFFSVTASGSGTLSYQWFVDDVAISSATNKSYLLNEVSLTKNGGIYRVEVTDDNGTISSNSATLTVFEPTLLVISSHPSDTTVTAGNDATFTVTASGSDTLSYQWFADDVAIPDATSNTYVLSDAALENDGSVFRVGVTDTNATIISNNATLTVTAPIQLQISGHPADTTVNDGDDAIFTVTASGNGRLSYQWFADDEAIPDATSSTYRLSEASSSNDGSVIRVEVTDSNGTISSNTAILTVIYVGPPATALNISQGILDSDKVLGPRWVHIDFEALTDGAHTISVSWDSDADVKFNLFTTDNTPISTTIRGTNPGEWSGDLDANEQYYMALWSADGTANYTATIEATVPVSIVSQPYDAIVADGDDAHFFVEATGSGALTYQWFVNGSPLLSETSDSLALLDTTLADDGAAITIEVGNGFETITSEVATLSVNERINLGLFSEDADTSTWMLEGPAPTLDYNVGADTDGWGQALLKVGNILFVGGDFQGVKPSVDEASTNRPYIAAFSAITGRYVTRFQFPSQIDSVVRTLAISPNGSQLYVGGDFGLVILNSTTGALNSSIEVLKGSDPGRVFDIAVTNSELYIGGDFNKVNGTPRTNLARISLSGKLDASWNPSATHGYSNGRSAPVQSLAVSPSGQTVYIGGNFQFINDTPVPTTSLDNRISMLSVSAIDGTVLPERFTPNVGSTNKSARVHDIAVTNDYVIIAWGGANYLSFHSASGDRLLQYRGKGDVQALQVVGNHLFVGHHGEFFNYTTDPIPAEAVVSLDPEIIVPYKLNSFRIDDPSFPPEQSWKLLGTFGVWGIAASEDSIWAAGELKIGGLNDRPVEGLVRFPALD